MVKALTLVDTAQFSEIQLLYDEDDGEYSNLVTSLYNFAVDQAPVLI